MRGLSADLWQLGCYVRLHLGVHIGIQNDTYSSAIFVFQTLHFISCATYLACVILLHIIFISCQSSSFSCSCWSSYFHSHTSKPHNVGVIIVCVSSCRPLHPRTKTYILYNNMRLIRIVAGQRANNVLKRCRRPAPIIISDFKNLGHQRVTLRNSLPFEWWIGVYHESFFFIFYMNIGVWW